MNHDEEVQVVKTALELEKDFRKKDDRYTSIKNEPAPPMPPKPVKAVIAKPDYPPIVSKIKFNFILALLSVFLTPVGTLIYIVIWRSQVKKDKATIAESPEYKASCKAIDQKYQEALNKAEADYKERVNEFETKTIVEYNKTLEAWKAKHDASLEEALRNKEDAQAALSKHYDDTKVIPAKYHEIEILEYLYSIISSSQYSLKECFDDYERNEAMKLENIKLQAQREANEIAAAQADLTAQQNALLDEQNSIAEKTRRDQNINNVIGIVQRHNTNKILKNR